MTLTIYYDHGEELFERDDEAKEIAGVCCVGAGTVVGGMVRDMQFRFQTKAALAEAKERFKDAGFRFFP